MSSSTSTEISPELQHYYNCAEQEAKLLAIEGPGGFAYRLAYQDSRRAWRELSPEERTSLWAD